MKYALGVLLCGLAVLGRAMPLLAQNDLDQRVAREMDSLVATYKHLHENPELSTQEKESSALVAAELRKLGYDVTDHFGQYDSPGLVSYGVVGVLRNGAGPTVYVRTDMDALPIVENTGLPYASQVKVKRADGAEVGVMHACGHDIHMSVFLGTARVLAQLKQQWSGTLVMLGQPAEETVGGAHAMLRAGLFTKFPKPNYVLALHDGSDLPAGKVGWREGSILAGADSVDITVRGYGGHGGAPQRAKDPILIASEIVVALQTIVSREMDPQVPTVVTVGSFHGGTKHNIIPDQAHLQLTVRTMTPAQREKVLAAITRITNGIAAASGVPADRAPLIEVAADHVPATINNPELTRRVAAALSARSEKKMCFLVNPPWPARISVSMPWKIPSRRFACFISAPPTPQNGKPQRKMALACPARIPPNSRRCRNRRFEPESKP